MGTLGEDVDVDYRKAAEDAAVAGLISGAAGYVYAKANGETENASKKVVPIDEIIEINFEYSNKLKI